MKTTPILHKNTKEFISFFKGVDRIYVDYMKGTFPTLAAEEMTFTQGSRYIKIIRGTSAHCFVDRTNGDVLKAASWRAPAKHARGNIFAHDNGLDRVGPYGAAYLKR